MTIDEIRDRVTSVCCASPFKFTVAQTPFSFDLQPSGVLDQVFRIESHSEGVLGGFNYSEERNDILQVWVARKYDANPNGAYDKLLIDASSIRAAVIRDGADVSGEYMVPDSGAGFSIQRPGGEYAVLRLSVPVNYETDV